MAVTWGSGLSEVAIKQFEQEFLLAQQQKKRKLEGKTTEIYGAVGGSYEVKVTNEWDMYDRGAYHSDPGSIIPEYRKVSVDRNEKVGKVPSDMFEQTKVNASEIRIQAMNAQAALNRMQDQVNIDALVAAKADMSEVAATSNLDVETLVKCQGQLIDNNVEDDDTLVVVGGYKQFISLLSDNTALSNDYNSTKVLTNGKIYEYVGFEFVWFGNMGTGGLPASGGVRDCFVFAKSALRSVYWLDPTLRIFEEPGKFTTYIAARLLMGSAVVLPDKCLYVPCTES